MPKGIAYIGSSSSHGGVIISSPSGESYANDQKIAVEGALHSCPIKDHGVTSIMPTTETIFHNDKKVIRQGDSAACGAVITGIMPNIGVGD